MPDPTPERTVAGPFVVESPELPEEPPPEVLTEDDHFDAELRSLVAIVETFLDLDPRAQKRVMRWMVSRYWPEKMLVNQ